MVEIPTLQELIKAQQDEYLAQVNQLPVCSANVNSECMDRISTNAKEYADLEESFKSSNGVDVGSK